MKKNNHCIIYILTIVLIMLYGCDGYKSKQSPNVISETLTKDESKNEFNQINDYKPITVLSGHLIEFSIKNNLLGESNTFDANNILNFVFSLRFYKNTKHPYKDIGYVETKKISYTNAENSIYKQDYYIVSLNEVSNIAKNLFCYEQWQDSTYGTYYQYDKSKQQYEIPLPTSVIYGDYLYTLININYKSNDILELQLSLDTSTNNKYKGTYSITYKILQSDNVILYNLKSIQSIDPIASTDFIDIRKYMNILVDYFHSPYQIGDPVSDINILYLCASLCCNGYLSSYMNFADFTVNESESIFTIPKNELDRLAKLLFGNVVTITDYNYFLPVNGYYDKYIENDGLYTFTSARDYWNGDNYFYDMENAVISENDNKLIVIADVYSYDSLANLNVEDKGTKLSYTFDKIIDRGITYYKLIKINESPSY